MSWRPGAWLAGRASDGANLSESARVSHQVDELVAGPGDLGGDVVVVGRLRRPARGLRQREQVVAQGAQVVEELLRPGAADGAVARREVLEEDRGPVA